MTSFQIIALLVTLTALTGFINHKFFRLSGSLGMTISGASVSMLAFAVGVFFPATESFAHTLFSAINFPETVFHGMLCFLLFAGAMHVDLSILSKWKVTVGVLATLGVAISAFVVAGVLWLLCNAAGISIPFVWLLVFGALISPTDPIAVLALLKKLCAPKDLETTIASESLANDGTGVVLYSVFLALVASSSVGAKEIATMFAHEAIGGVAFGFAMGVAGHYLLKMVNDAPTEMAMTLAFALGSYVLGETIHVSAPLATATMGLIIGHGKKSSMQESTREKLIPFWEMFDELLNMALFALVGIAMMAVSFSYMTVFVALAAIVAALVGRSISVGLPLWAMSFASPIPKGTVPTMIWGGLRGGLSLAMALSLPDFEQKEMLVTATWSVVMFSLLVQAPTMSFVMRKAGVPTSN